jgi:RNA polymerase sigma-70 factor (ECF subfamily)
MFLFKRTYYRQQSDEELLDLFRSKQDSRCLGELYERYGHLVFGVCLKYLKTKMDAEDMTSDLFEKLPKRILDHEITHFKSWLYTVTRNECFMLLRKKSIHSEEIQDQFLSDNEPEHEEQLEKELMLEKLEGSVMGLKEEQRVCIHQFFMEKKSYEQISQDLQIPLKQVKSAIQNGKRNLKIRLDQTFESEQ